ARGDLGFDLQGRYRLLRGLEILRPGVRPGRPRRGTACHEPGANKPQACGDDGSTTLTRGTTNTIGAVHDVRPAAPIEPTPEPKFRAQAFDPDGPRAPWTWGSSDPGSTIGVVDLNLAATCLTRPGRSGKN